MTELVALPIKDCPEGSECVTSESHPEHRVVIRDKMKILQDAGERMLQNVRQTSMKTNFGSIILHDEVVPAPADALRLYTQRQRENSAALHYRYTSSEKELASLAWSAQLRAKVQASAAADQECERLKVVCDRGDQDDE